MEYQNEILNIQNNIYRQTNYYTRELERIIDKLKIDSNLIDIKFLQKKPP